MATDGIMASATFEPSLDFERVIARNTAVTEGRVRAAKAVAAAVEAAAPDHTGRFRNSIRVDESGDVVRVKTTDPAGHLIEWGSVNNPPYAPFREGIARAGFRLEPKPKP